MNFSGKVANVTAFRGAYLFSGEAVAKSLTSSGLSKTSSQVSAELKELGGLRLGVKNAVDRFMKKSDIEIVLTGEQAKEFSLLTKYHKEGLGDNWVGANQMRTVKEALNMLLGGERRLFGDAHISVKEIPAKAAKNVSNQTARLEIVKKSA